MDDIALARALHVLAVVHWIGGVAFVTLVVLPLAALRPSAQEGLRAVRGRGAALRRAGPYFNSAGRRRRPVDDLADGPLGTLRRSPLLVDVGDARALARVRADGFRVGAAGAHGRFARRAQDDPAAVLRRVARLHFVLLALAALTVLGAVAGAHGFNFF